MDDNSCKWSPWVINRKIQKLESLPKMPCTWVTEMKKVSLEAFEMDLRLKWSDFGR